jgi:PAS domain S-box-containing protein
MNDSDKNVLSIIENSLQGVTIATGVSPKIILTNKALEEAFGYTDKELKSFSPRQLTNLIYPADRKKFFGNYKARLAGGKAESVYNVRIFNKKGEIRSVKISSQPIIFNGKPAIKTNYLDVTEKNLLSEKVSIIESILPAISAGLLVVDNNNKVTLLNDSFLKLWGIPRILAEKKDDKKLIKFVLNQLVSPEEFLSRVRYLYTHPHEKSRDTIKFKDGKIFERCSCPQIKNDKIVGRVWAFNDITAASKQLSIQKELMEKYEMATSVSGQIFYEYKISTGAIEWAGPIYEVLGYTKEEFKKVNVKEWLNLIHPDDRKSAEEMLLKAREKMGHYKCKYRFKIKNNGYAYVLDIGKFFRDPATHKIRMIGSIQDISELVKEKAKSDALIQAIGDGVMIINQHSEITYINEAGQKMLGYPLKEIIGNKCGQICSHHPGMRPNTSKDKCPTVLARKLHKNVTKTLRDDYYYTRADGSHFPVYISTSPLYVEGKDAGGILIFRDISEEKDVDKMKSEFISVSSHQLRTPITGINWLTEALLEKGTKNLSPDQRKMIEDIHTSNHHMISLVNLLLTVARLDMGTFPVEPIDIDLELICKSTLRELEDKIVAKNIKMQLSCLCGSKKYKADPHIMEMIFQNLLSNAVKYTKKNTTVVIRGHLVKNELIISVTDRGIGIPKEQQSKIFGRLFRADNAQNVDTAGVGLGLYITKSVVEAVGGRIWFESKVNVGTTFFVALPAKGMKAKKGPTSTMS